jgi:hypothetical protein
VTATRSKEIRVGTSMKDAPRLMARVARSPHGLASIAIVIALFALLPSALKMPIAFPVAVALFATLMQRATGSECRTSLTRTAPDAAISVDTLLIGERAPYPTAWKSGKLHVDDDSVRWTPASHRIEPLDLRALAVRCVATREAEGRERLHVKTNVFRVLDLRDASDRRITLAVPAPAVEFVASKFGSRFAPNLP